MDGDATRGRTLLEESREAVVVLDDTDRVIGASRRARLSIDGLREGERIPDGLLSGDAGIVPFVVPYDVGGRRERLVYLSRSGDLTAYEELRTGFTAAVSPWTTQRWNASFTYGDAFGAWKSASAFVSFSVKSSAGAVPSEAIEASIAKRPSVAWSAITPASPRAASVGFRQQPSWRQPQLHVFRNQSVGSTCRRAASGPRFSRRTRTSTSSPQTSPATTATCSFPGSPACRKTTKRKRPCFVGTMASASTKSGSREGD